MIRDKKEWPFTKSIRHVLQYCVLALGLISSAIWPVFAQRQETEPNGTCLSPQEIEDIILPIDLTGSLDWTPEFPDVDFFHFAASRGEVVRVDLGGATTGAGTLGDPFLGIFDSQCHLLFVDDDGGVGLNSCLQFEVPGDGGFVAPVTACCDGGFAGGGVGTYRLTVRPFAAAGSISGRLVDADTGAPLPGDGPPFAIVQLFRCELGECFEFVNSQPTNTQGRFLLLALAPTAAAS